MHSANFITKQQLADQLGLSTSTLYRMLRKKNIHYDGKLLSPRDQIHIKKMLGFEENTSHQAFNHSIRSRIMN